MTTRSRDHSRGSTKMITARSIAQPPGAPWIALLGSRVFLAIVGLSAPVASAQSISEIGSLLPNNNCHVTGVSADGSVVVGYSNVAVGNHAFRWTAAGGIQDLGDFGYSSAALAVSADGTCVAGWASVVITRPDGTPGTYARVIRWTVAQGLQDVGGSPVVDPSTHIANSGIGRAVSADGSVIVGDGGGVCAYNVAFRWTQATGPQSLGTFFAEDPCFSDVTVEGVSADGTIAVGENGRRAYRWVLGAGMVNLGNPAGDPAAMAQATGVSADGSVVVGVWGVNAAGGHMQAFRWREGVGMENLGSLGGDVQFGSVRVSADGATVIGASGTPGGTVRPFLWTSQLGMTDLQAFLESLGVDLSGWRLDDATGVSADGRVIVGNAGLSPGGTSGFIVSLVACPADFNHDGDVNPDDLGDYITCYFSEPPCSGADFNADGEVNPDDLGDYITTYFGPPC